MKIKITLNHILFWYSLLFVFLNLVLGFVFGVWKNNPLALIAFTLVLIYLIFKKFISGKISRFIFSILNLFCYLLVAVIWLMNLLVAQSTLQLILGLTFTPLVFFFGLELVNQIKNLISHLNFRLPPTKPTPPPPEKELTQVQISDQSRRQFLKMAGSAGLGLAALTLVNPKKASASFFGSVPGPGTISIKDTGGNKIDPAAKQPTDGYKISKMDDTSSDTYSYYGFVDQSGQWYIQRETTSGVGEGDFLYCNGVSDFTTAWNDKENQTYESFDTIF